MHLSEIQIHPEVNLEIMNRQVFRNSNEHCRRDQQLDTICLDRLANMNVSSIDTCDSATMSLSQKLSPSGRRSSIEQLMSFDRVKSRSLETDEREDSFAIPIISKLSECFHQDYPFRDIATDSRDPEEELETNFRSDDDQQRTAATKMSSKRNTRNNQDIFISSTPRAKTGSREWSRESSQTASGNADNNPNSFWASVNCLKRANPIYESDAEYEETDEIFSNAISKRRCAIDNRITTAIFWQEELKSADE